MNEIFVNNDNITAEHSLAGQHENLARNQFNSSRFDNVIEKSKKFPMTPTRLYVLFFSSQSS